MLFRFGRQLFDFLYLFIAEVACRVYGFGHHVYGFWWLESDSSEFIDDDFEKCFRNVADKLLFVVDSLFHVSEEFVVEYFEIDLASNSVEFLFVVDFL